MITTDEFLIASVEGKTPELFKSLGISYWRHSAEVIREDGMYDTVIIVNTLVPSGHDTLMRRLRDEDWHYVGDERYDDYVKFRKMMTCDVDGVFRPFIQEPVQEKKSAEELLKDIDKTLKETLDMNFVGEPMTDKRMLEFYKTHYIAQAEHIISLMCDGDNLAGRELLLFHAIEDVSEVFEDMEFLRTPNQFRKGKEPMKSITVTFQINY